MNRTQFLGASAAVALAGGSVRANAQSTPTLVRVATTPIDAGAQPYFAEAMGFFKEANLKVEIQSMSNGSAIAAAVASGAVDIGQSNVVSVASAHEHGIPFTLIAGGNLVVARVHQAEMLVPNASPIHTAKDLDGKTVSVNGLFTIPHIGAKAWIDQNGGNSANVKFVEIPFPAMGAALESGRIDCAFISEPQLDDAKKSGHFRVIASPYEAIAKTFLLGGWFTTLTWAKANSATARSYAAVMDKTAKWANANQAASGKILATETGVAVSPTMARVQFGGLDPALIQPVLDASAKYGALKATFPASEILAPIPR